MVDTKNQLNQIQLNQNIQLFLCIVFLGLIACLVIHIFLKLLII